MDDDTATPERIKTRSLLQLPVIVLKKTNVQFVQIVLYNVKQISAENQAIKNVLFSCVCRYTSDCLMKV